MKTICFGLAGVVAVALFGAFGSVGAVPRASVDTHVASMYAVLRDGALVELAASPR
jgi:hypothetical protein